MARVIIGFGVLFAGMSLVLNWLQFQLLTRDLKTEIIIGIIAVIFVAIGVWLGISIRKKPATEFVRNDKAINNLGLSLREFEVLEHLANGAPNKIIARKLEISPNTVKTHISRVIEKLGAQNRTQAIAIARELSILP